MFKCNWTKHLDRILRSWFSKLFKNYKPHRLRIPGRLLKIILENDSERGQQVYWLLDWRKRLEKYLKEIHYFRQRSALHYNLKILLWNANWNVRSSLASTRLNTLCRPHNIGDLLSCGFQQAFKWLKSCSGRAAFSNMAARSPSRLHTASCSRFLTF
jgi:hypothetical protein